MLAGCQVGVGAALTFTPTNRAESTERSARYYESPQLPASPCPKFITRSDSRIHRVQRRTTLPGPLPIHEGLTVPGALSWGTEGIKRPPAPRSYKASEAANLFRGKL